MNQQFRSIFFISVSIAFVAFLHSCKKTAPSLATLCATDRTFATATSGGIIFSDGGSPITGKGVCWSTHENPTLSDDRIYDDTGTKRFTSEIW